MANISENIKDNLSALFSFFFILLLGLFQLVESFNLPEEMNTVFIVIGFLGIVGSLFVSSP